MTEVTLTPPAPEAPHEAHASFWHSLLHFVVSGIETLGKAEVLALIPEPEKAYAVAVVAVATGAETLLASAPVSDTPTPAAPPAAPAATPVSAEPAAPVAPVAAPVPEPVIAPVVPFTHTDTAYDVETLIAKLALLPEWAGNPIAFISAQLRQRVGVEYTDDGYGVRTYVNGNGTLDTRNAAANNFPLPGA